MSRGTNPAAVLSYGREYGADIVDPDAELVARSRDGDLAAFEQLVNKHQKQMLNIAFRLIGDYEEACEAVQDAFVAAYRNLATFRAEAKFSTWLTTITLNHGRNRLKQARSRTEHISCSLDQSPVDGSDLTKDPPSSEPSALERLEARDIQARVRACIDALEPEFREVLILRDLQDYSYQEIGTAIKAREGTVKSRLFRAREAVKECLKRALGEL